MKLEWEDNQNTVAICGCGRYGKVLYGLLNKNKVKTVAFLDNAVDKWNTAYEKCSIIPTFKAKQIDDEVNYFVIPGTYKADIINNLYYQLLLLGINEKKIYVAPIEMLMTEYYNTTTFLGGIIEYRNWCTLPYLEFPVSLHCNQQCASCLHFSPLSEKHFYDLEEFKRDITQLKMIVNHIETIRIMGGEPLLNPDLGEILEFTRKIYPYARLVLVTNGLLLKRMKKELIHSILKTNTIVSISLYPSLYSQIESICDFLNENKIQYARMDSITFFRKGLSTEKRKNPYLPNKPDMCKCVNMFEGKMSVCPMAMYVNILNKKLKYNFPENGYWKLDDVMNDIDKFKNNLQSSIELCEYCRVYSEWNQVDMKDKWRTINGVIDKNDWVK